MFRGFSQKKNPQESANVLSFVTFWWLNSFMKKGNRKTLDLKDLYQVMRGDQANELGNNLEQKLNQLGIGKVKLMQALLHMFGPRVLLITGLIFSGNCLFGIGSLLCLPLFIRSFDDDTLPFALGYLYAIIVVLGPGLYTVVYNLTYFALQREGMRVRIAVSSLIYRKCMTLNQRDFCTTNVGQIFNLMTRDVHQLESFIPMSIGFPLAGIFQMIVSLSLPLYLVGPSCCVGLSTMVLFLAFEAFGNDIFNSLIFQNAKRSDERIGFINEIISGIRVIKMYAWEIPFLKMIDKYRRREVKIFRHFTYFKCFCEAIYEMSAGMTILLTILTEVLLGNQLSVEKVYLTVALFGNMKLIMTYLPDGIFGLNQMKVSIDRITRFLLLSNGENDMKVENSSSRKTIPPFISCDNLTAKWPINREGVIKDILSNLTFSIQNGQSIGIVGTVGSGKSSLLNVFLGELHATSGVCQVVGKLAYASQDPWILPTTVEGNILCGLKRESDRYSRVIKACSLYQDLEQFPKGDATEVGEISLSGGQKARINLARALYVDADIYLLDDPLSSVDACVGRLIYTNAIRELLKDKIVVLVTHQIHLLQDMEQIIVLKKGKIEAIGKFETISTDVRFRELFGKETTDGKPLFHDQSNEMRENVNAPFQNEDVVKNKILVQMTEDPPDEPPSFKIPSTKTKKKINRSSMIWNYLREGGSLTMILLSSFFFLIMQFSKSVEQYWLTIVTESAKISNDANYENFNYCANTTVCMPLREGFLQSFNSTIFQNEQENSEVMNDWLKPFDTRTNIYIYSLLIGSSVIIILMNLVLFYIICLNSSISIHNGMTRAVLKAPMHFFDCNPIGNILNRFSNDIRTIDSELPSKFYSTLKIVLYAFGRMLLIGWFSPWLLLPVPFILSIFYVIREYYLETARDLKRLESSTYSSMLIQLSTTLNGLTTLRAHRCQSAFRDMFDHYQDVQTSAYYLNMAASRWFAVRLDFFCIIYSILVSISCFALRDSITGSEAGLIICSVGEILAWFEYGICMANETDNDLLSVERTLQFSKDLSSEGIDTESISKSITSLKMDAKNVSKNSIWPFEGAIHFENVSLSYGGSRDDTLKSTKKIAVLKNISFSIEPKEKIGIVGRTGAGKSSLIVALFRLMEPNGIINIDGVNTKTIGLPELRSKISIVPQDPFLFTGSFRDNLDPFGEYEESELWQALETVELMDMVKENSSFGLNAKITEGGGNLSVGQRQLLCLARAILRRNQILVMDEATSNIDFETDALIQRTIKHSFRDCTVLTIAHRLNTIMDSNRVMVIDDGFLREFDKPAVLISQPESLFHQLVKRSGAFVESIPIDHIK